MKKRSALLLCLFLMAGLCACAAVEQPTAPTTTQGVEHTYPGFPDAPESFTGMGEAELGPYFELAQEAYKRYILAAQFPDRERELPQFPMQMTPPLRKYMELRFANDTKSSIGVGCELLSIETSMNEGFMGDTWQRRWKIIDGKLLCSPGVTIEFRYPGADFDSGFGMGAQLLIENPRNPTLVDWFDLEKISWDRQMRQGHYDLPEDADPWAVRQWPVSWNLGDPENWLGTCEMLPPADKIFD